MIKKMLLRDSRRATLRKGMNDGPSFAVVRNSQYLRTFLARQRMASSIGLLDYFGLNIQAGFSEQETTVLHEKPCSLPAYA